MLIPLRLVSDCESTGNSPTGRESYFKAKYGNWYHGPTFCTNPVSARRQALKKQICYLSEGLLLPLLSLLIESVAKSAERKTSCRKEDADSGYMHVVSIKNYEV